MPHLMNNTLVTFAVAEPIMAGDLLVLTNDGRVRRKKSGERPTFLALESSTSTGAVVARSHAGGTSVLDRLNEMEDALQKQYDTNVLAIVDTMRARRPKAHISWERDITRRTVVFRLHCDVCRDFKFADIAQMELESCPTSQLQQRAAEAMLCCPTWEQAKVKRDLVVKRLNTSYTSFVRENTRGAPLMMWRAPRGIAAKWDLLTHARGSMEDGRYIEETLCVYVGGCADYRHDYDLNKVHSYWLYHELRPVVNGQIGPMFRLFTRDIEDGLVLLREPTTRQREYARVACEAYRAELARNRTPYWNPEEGA